MEERGVKGDGVLHTTITTKYIYLIQIDTLLLVREKSSSLPGETL